MNQPQEQATKWVVLIISDYGPLEPYLKNKSPNILGTYYSCLRFKSDLTGSQAFTSGIESDQELRKLTTKMT